MNILFLTNVKNRPAQADRIFLKFIIEILLKNENYFNYGLVSFHLFLNRFDDYNIYLFIKNLNSELRDFTNKMVIKGLMENKAIDQNPKDYFSKIKINTDERFVNINNISYINFFNKLFGYSINKCELEPLINYKDNILKHIKNNINNIFSNDNLFLLFKTFYLLFYDIFSDLFKEIDEIIKKKLDSGDKIFKISELSELLKLKIDHPFFRKFTYEYINLINILEEQEKIHQIGSILKCFSYDFIELKIIKEDILDKIELYVRMNNYLEINEIYIYLKDLVERKERKNEFDPIFRSSLNRLATIYKDKLNNIIKFLNADWKSIKSDVDGDKKLNKKFKELFFYLGFEIIPVELLINQDRYKSLSSLVHPDIILYDFNSDLIILLEEDKKLETQTLYKKDVILKILELFQNLFPRGFKNFIFQYLVSTVSSAINQLDEKPNIIIKDRFIDLLTRIFNEVIFTINIFEDNDYKMNLNKCIKMIKGNLPSI